MAIAIAQDDVLRQAVEDYPIAQLIAGSLIEDEVRGVLAETNTSATVKSINAPRKKDKNKWGPWIIAATLLSALWVSHYQWERHSEQEVIHGKLMAQLVPIASKTTRSTTFNENDRSMESGIKAYDLRKFEKSKSILESIRPKNDTIYYYLAHIALIQNKVGSARKYEKKLSNPIHKKEIQNYLSWFQ